MARNTPLLEDAGFIAALESEQGGRSIGREWGIAHSAVTKYRKRMANGEPLAQGAASRASGIVTATRPTPVTYRFESDGETVALTTRATAIAQSITDIHDGFRAEGHDPDDYDITVKFINWENGSVEEDGTLRILHYASAMAKRKVAGKNGGAAWPVVQQGQPVSIKPPKAEIVSLEREPGMKCALKFADHQIGYRILDDGTLDPFHDVDAMALSIVLVRMYRPDKITILGDYLDLPSQSRWAQEASFARSTQPALDTGHAYLAQLRAAAPDAEIVIVEGNHDKRLQNSIEANALASFGLKRANMPDSWPVMSLPHMLRLDELDVKYVDAYPAATDWDNDATRNIHGTRANSKGSTTSQYVSELPHVNTWAGHTHRAEITYKTVLGHRGIPVESYSANPGCMCRTDGSVPGVNAAIGADGVPAKIVEDWQNGFGVLYYNETESWPQVHRIRDGITIIDGKRISVK